MSFSESLTIQNETSSNKPKILNTNRNSLKCINSRNQLSLPKMKTAKEILKEVSRNKELHGPLFRLTNSKSKKENKQKKHKNFINHSLKSTNPKEEDYKSLANFNVFNSEDQMIKNLMYQFNIKKKHNKTNKLQRRQEVLNKLYGFSENFSEKVNEIKRQKNLDLTKYQNNILNALSMNMSDQYELMELLEKLNEVRNECESVSPLPRINIKNIYDHVYNQKSKSIRKMPLRKFLEKSNEPKDEFEKEERLINKIKGVKVLPKKKRNKVFDNLPGYLKDIFSK